MKKLFITFLCLFSIITLIAQKEIGNYQILVKQGQEEINTDKARVLVAFLQDNIQHRPIYTEIHLNQEIENGLLTLRIGKGVSVNGSIRNIDVNKPLFIRYLIDPHGGTNYLIEGNDSIMALKNLTEDISIDTNANLVNGCRVNNINKNEVGKRKMITAVRDHEGNSYEVVQLGGNCWLRENMRCTTLRNTQQDILQTKTEYSESKGYAYHYDNNPEYSKTYGLLYNWTAASNICPAGWHLPSQKDWKELFAAAGVNEANASNNWNGNGAVRLSTGNEWKTSSVDDACGNVNHKDRNISNFSILPGGELTSNFNSITRYANFWSSTQCSKLNAFYVYMAYNSGSVNIGNYGKHNGYSVRCVRNE